MLTKIHGILVKKGIIVFAILCAFAVLAGASGCRRAAVLQPQDFEYLDGKLVHRQGKVLCLESVDGSKTYFLVGRRTVFTPKARPSLGDRLRVKYYVQAYPHKSFGRYYVGYEVAQIPDIEKVPRVTASSPPTQKPKETPEELKSKKIAKQKQKTASAPSLVFHGISIKPLPVRAGEKFTLEVEFTVTDPAVKAKRVPVQFSFEILSGPKVIGKEKTIQVDAFNGSTTQQLEKMSTKTATTKGAYSIRVSLKYKDMIKKDSVDLTIQ